MSYPYPQDRHRDRKEKGEQPYKDAAETLSQNEAEIAREADVTDEDRRQRDKAEQEREAEERFEEIANEDAEDGVD